MRKISSILYILLALYSCKDTKEDQFLNNFKDTIQVHYTSYIKNQREIKNEDLHILNKTDAINEFVYNKNKKYYYGYKTKISDDHYLLSYYVTYFPFYRPVNRLTNWEDSYLCVFEKRNGVVSKIKITSSDPILSGFKEKHGVYTVNSYKNQLKYKEDEDQPYFYFDSIISKYKIENNRFVEIK